ncbi:MAG: PAS domain S-box protein [Victivallaceae bacterium]|nr:PAS domain S-box protein [Victivallaceae bacterium]
MKIQTKLTGFLVIMLAVFSYLLIWLSTYSYRQELVRLNRAVAREQIRNMIMSLVNQPSTSSADDAKQQMRSMVQSRYQAHAKSYPVIIDNNGRWLAHPVLRGARIQRSMADINRFIQQGSGKFQLEVGSKSRIIYYEVLRPGNWLVGWSTPAEGTFMDSMIPDANYRLAVAVMCGVAIAAGCLFWLLQKALSPLNLLVDSAADMAAGRFPEVKPDKKYPEDEIGILARSFDDMACKIRNSLDELYNEIQVRRKREHEFRELLENSPLPILIIRAGHGFTTNNMFKKLFGWSSNEIADLEKWFFRVIFDDHNHQANFQNICRMLKAQHHSAHAIMPLRSRDGRRLDIEIRQKLIADNNLLMFNDLTERKVTERKLRDTWNYLNLLFNSLQLLIIAVNKEGIITQWNHSCASYSGINSRHAVGARLWKIAPFMKPFRKDIETAIFSGLASELHRKTIDLGGEKFFNIVITPLMNEDNPGAVIMLEDVTDMIRQGEELIQAQKMETVGTLTGGLAHDFNNVLGGIKGSLSMINHLINQSPPNISEIKEFIELSDKSVARAANMVEQLLTLSRKSQLKVSPVNLIDVVENVLIICGATFDKSIAIKFRKPEIAPIVEADHNQIEQVVLNLMINAEHAMTIMRQPDEPHGGVIELRINRIMPENNGSGSGFFWALSIRDHGVGIPPSIQRKIFDPFFTTKEKGFGSGLGLSMVYNIILQHQGFVEVKSEQGQGSEFTICLPESFAHTGNTAPDLRCADPVHGTGCILIIDDETAIRKTAAAMLKLLGYDTISAHDGETGLLIYRENIGKIDAVLLDMVMPGISGKETFFKLKEVNPEAKIILSSGFPNDQRVTEVMNAGADGFLKKPYSLAALSLTMHKLLRKKL